MARNVRDTALDTRNARRKISKRREPYWTKLGRGAHLGYRKVSNGVGNWIARFRDDAGQRLQKAIGPADDVMDADGVSAISFEQAQAKARDWFQSAATLGTGRKRGAYTVADCMTDYLDYIRNHKKSARHLDTYANAYIMPKIGRVDTTKLTTPMIRKWHQDIAKEPPRLRTSKGKEQKYRDEDPDPKEAERKRRLRANRHLVTLRAALNRGWSEGLIAHNDAWMRVKPYAGTERQRTRILTREQAQRLLNTCEPDLRDLIHAALTTGARYGELSALDVGDFHADSGTLFVRDSKSGQPRRIVLNAEGAQFCKRLVTGRITNEPLLRKAGGGRWDRDHYFRRFKDAIVRAGIDPRFTFHELRHTWASLTVMAGAPLMVVAQNLGHRDTRMVEKHYGHLTDNFVADTIRRTGPNFCLSPEPNVVPLARAPQPAANRSAAG